MAVDVIDRVPTQPGRVKITHADGSSEYVTIERADAPTVEGTPINRALFQGAAPAGCGTGEVLRNSAPVTNPMDISLKTGVYGWCAYEGGYGITVTMVTVMVGLVGDKLTIPAQCCGKGVSRRPHQIPPYLHL